MIQMINPLRSDVWREQVLWFHNQTTTQDDYFFWFFYQCALPGQRWHNAVLFPPILRRTPAWEGIIPLPEPYFIRQDKRWKDGSESGFLQ